MIASRHGLEFISLAHVRRLKAGTHGVHVKEGVFAVLDLCYRVSVKRLVTRVSGCGQVHPRILFLNLNALEFSIEELTRVSGILDFTRLHFAIETTELFLFKFTSGRSSETVNFWRDKAFNIFAINSGATSFSKRATVQVFTLNLRNVASIVRNVLCLDIGSGTTKPIFALFRIVSDKQLLVLFVLDRGLRIKFTLSKLGLAYGNINVKVGRLVPCLSDNLIDVASCAAENFVFLGDVTCVARQVVLIVGDVSHIVILSKKANCLKLELWN